MNPLKNIMMYNQFQLFDTTYVSYKRNIKNKTYCISTNLFYTLDILCVLFIRDIIVTRGYDLKYYNTYTVNENDIVLTMENIQDFFEECTGTELTKEQAIKLYITIITSKDKTSIKLARDILFNSNIPTTGKYIFEYIKQYRME